MRLYGLQSVSYLTTRAGCTFSPRTYSREGAGLDASWGFLSIPGYRGLVFGVELSPASALVRPYRSAMFHTYAASGKLAGLLVGGRASSRDVWQSAIERVTVEAVIVQGISLHIGPWRDLIASGDLGWPLFGAVHARQSFVVYVRNDAAELRELRAVLVLQGDGGGERRRPGRLRAR